MAKPVAFDALWLMIGLWIASTAALGTAVAQPACRGHDGTSFPQQLRDWLTERPSSDALTLLRDPISGFWRIRLGLVATVPSGQHAKVAAPGRIVAASCRASCAVLIDHGAGYVARYGGLAHARFRTGACASAPTNLALKRRADRTGQFTFVLSRNGRAVDPREVAGISISKP